MLAIVVGITIAAGALGAQPSGAAECRSIGAAPARAWRFEPAGTGWTVVHTRGTGRPTRLALPRSTEARFTPGEVRVRSRTSNGGIDVTLSGPAQAATLDAYVSYELEVNVDASLTLAVDELNTGGPVAVRCDVTGETR